MDRLKGKVAVITGANSGVGEATALAFAKDSGVCKSIKCETCIEK